jgi:sulfur relay (sulfurtransferase) DsrF/TusC family protein
VELDFFINERLDFAAYFYEGASKPFVDIIEAIEQQNDPYDSPSFADSGEPPFLAEWQEAKAALDSVGISALSMIASSVQLFLDHWVSRLEAPDTKFKRKHRKRGWFHAYKLIISQVGLSLDNCPADIDLIEQCVLVRNRGQHPEHLTILNISHSHSDLDKYPCPYFVSGTDARIIELEGEERSWWLTPAVYVNEEKLSKLIFEVKTFCDWLEKQYR